jgi:hypothetical protein
MVFEIKSLRIEKMEIGQGRPCGIWAKWRLSLGESKRKKYQQGSSQKATTTR